MKMIISDVADEKVAFLDNVMIYEKVADFLRDCIDAFRTMVRQKEI